MEEKLKILVLLLLLGFFPTKAKFGIKTLSQNHLYSSSRFLRTLLQNFVFHYILNTDLKQACLNRGMSLSIREQILAKIKQNKASLQPKQEQNPEAQTQAKYQSARIEALKAQVSSPGEASKNKVRSGFSRTPVTISNKISGAA